MAYRGFGDAPRKTTLQQKYRNLGRPYPPLSKDSSHPPLWLVIHGTDGSEIPNNHRLDGAKTL